MLNESVFEKIIQHFQIHPQMNFFASRLIKQLPVFASNGSTCMIPQKPRA